MRGRMEGREPTGDCEPSNPSPSYRPWARLAAMTDDEVERYAEECYRRRMDHFVVVVAPARRTRKRRRFSEYTAKNCEEAYGGRP